MTTTAEQGSGKDAKDRLLAEDSAASVAGTLSTSMLKLVPATITKDISGDSRTIPVGKKSEKRDEVQGAQEKEPLPSSNMAGSIVSDSQATMQVVPVGLPPAMSEKATLATSSNTTSVQPVLQASQQSSISSKDVAMVLPEKPEPKETEAFSLSLERQVTPRSAGSAAVGNSPKESKNVPETASQPSQPSPLVQSNKAANSLVASNSSSAIPIAERSGSSKFSGGDGGTEQRDKDQAALSKAALRDAAESKQGFPDYGSSSAAFVRDTAAPEQSRTVQAPMQPAIVENQEPTTGVAKEVAIRLQNESGEAINVKLVDQGGQVQVTVRSTDPSTAASLREDLSSLTSSLEKAGWKSEVSLPAGTSFEPVNQTRHADRESQDTPGQRQADWQQETPKKRQSSTDAWDEMLTNQAV